MQPTIETHTTSTPERAIRAALGFVAITLTALLASCGARHAEQAANAAGDEGTAVVYHGGTVAAVPASAPAAPSFNGRVVSLGDSLPPEVAVTVEDTLVRAGDVIEITADGSDDVSQVGLSDAIGRVQLFTRDPAGNSWHILYRVPLRVTGDRIGLSVTAVNDLNRWRRVWVFLRLRVEETPTPADSSGSPETVSHS